MTLRRILLCISILCAIDIPLEKNAGAEERQKAEVTFSEDEGWVAMFNGRDLSGWRSKEPNRKHEWIATESVHFDPDKSPDRLIPDAEFGGVIVNGLQGYTSDLVSESKLGDVELYVEFMLSVARGSQSNRVSSPILPTTKTIQ